MASVNLGKVAITSGGNYNAGTTYPILTTVVGTDGKAYITKVNNVLGISPGVTSGWQNYWVLFAERGIGISTIAKTGTAGLVDTYTITYDGGATQTFTVTNGSAATVTVGTVTTGNPGTNAVVTNSGTSQAAVLNFTIPAGIGLSSGGTTGQVLKKRSNTNYDTEWDDVSDLVIDDSALSNTKAYSSQKCNSTFAKLFVASSVPTLTVAGWSNSAPFTQTISVTGVLSTDVLDIYPDMSSATVETAPNILAAFACIGRVQSGSGQVTFYCYSDKPTTDFTPMIKAVR